MTFIPGSKSRISAMIYSRNGIKVITDVAARKEIGAACSEHHTQHELLQPLESTIRFDNNYTAHPVRGATQAGHIQTSAVPVIRSAG